MTKNKINLNASNIKKLPIPTNGKRVYYYDNKVPGLGIMIFPTGTKTFFLYKRVDGKPDKIKLGRFPDMHPEQAYNAAYKLMNEISDGINPNQQKKNLRSEMTFEDLFEKYLNEYAKIRKSSWNEDLGYYNRHLTSLNNKRISDIQRSDIERLHNKIKDEKGVYAANRSLALLSKIYNKAIDWGFENNNPCKGIQKFKEKSRDRFLQGDEISRFFEELNNEPNETFKDFFYISLLTGARRNNVQSMNWNDINFNRAEWLVQETKNGEPHTIPLIPQAITILKERYIDKSNDWVFPSLTSRSGHIEEPKKVWKNLLERAGIKDLRIHDLRRTLGSWQAATGANSYIIGKSLGHKTQQATAIYARLNIDPVRESVSKAADAMFAAMDKFNN
jgi:integrase